MDQVPELTAQVLRRALELACGPLRAERALAVCGACGASRGLNTATLWLTGEVSKTIVCSLLEDGEPLILLDAFEDPRYREQTSAILAARRSALFVPALDEAGRVKGFLYADKQETRGFGDVHLVLARKFVHDQLEPCLPPLGEALDWEGLQRTVWMA